MTERTLTLAPQPSRAAAFNTLLAESMALPGQDQDSDSSI
jgi:hypothetical protein